MGAFQLRKHWSFGFVLTGSLQKENTKLLTQTSCTVVSGGSDKGGEPGPTRALCCLPRSALVFSDRPSDRHKAPSDKVPNAGSGRHFVKQGLGRLIDLFHLRILWPI